MTWRKKHTMTWSICLFLNIFIAAWYGIWTLLLLLWSLETSPVILRINNYWWTRYFRRKTPSCLNQFYWMQNIFKTLFTDNQLKHLWNTWNCIKLIVEFSHCNMVLSDKMKYLSHHYFVALFKLCQAGWVWFGKIIEQGVLNFEI